MSDPHYGACLERVISQERVPRMGKPTGGLGQNSAKKSQDSRLHNLQHPICCLFRDNGPAAIERLAFFLAQG